MVGLSPRFQSFSHLEVSGDPVGSPGDLPLGTLVLHLVSHLVGLKTPRLRPSKALRRAQGEHKVRTISPWVFVGNINRVPSRPGD